jgi:EAL domain-containing protein (putative c-di-GMP-specific phosphodiesterase class I)
MQKMAGAAWKIATGPRGESAASSHPGEGARPSGTAFAVADLENCIRTISYFVEYQPKVALLSNAASQFGVEALCRIQDPVHGRVAPDVFIGLAEKHALIGTLTDCVVRDAFAAWRTWFEAGLCVRLALNVSPLLLTSEEWCKSFLATCAEFAIEPKWITLEITETAAGATDSGAQEILYKLQRKGFSLSIDDFGTGFSSLATLYKLPVSEMKIDKSFILDFQEKPGARELVESAVAMAKRLGIKVVAEGVETESLFREMRRIGCDEAQGFFIGKSMPANSVVPFFTSWNSAEPQAGAGGAAGAPPKIVVAQALLNELIAGFSASGAAPANSYARFAAPRNNPLRAQEILQKIPSLILSGQSLQALAHCHNALRELTAKFGGGQSIEKLRQVQLQLEHELSSTADVELRPNYETIRLLPRSSITIGRPCSTGKVDVPIACRWLGTGDRNLRIFRNENEYYLEDLGSPNAHLANGERLKIKEPLEIPYGRTIVEPLLISGAVAPIAIVLHRKSSDPDAIAICLDCDKDILRADLSEEEWPKLREQLGITWVVFSKRLSVGKSRECAVVISDLRDQVAATVTFEHGLMIEPIAGSALEMNGIGFDQQVPLVADAHLRLSGVAIETRQPG